MIRSALLVNVAHDQLHSELGNYIASGWRVWALHPSSETITPVGGHGIVSRTVTHWTVVLERSET